MKIKNWKKFQHFKDRRPPWIKLYRDILDDVEWHELDAQSAKILVMLWLIASEDESGNLPSLKTLAFRLRVSEKLIESTVYKLSHWMDYDDTAVISRQYQSDLPETETETETELETEKKKQTATRLPVDWNPNDEEILYCKTKRPDLQWQQVAENFRDYWIAQAGAKGKKADWSATWRTWVRNEKSAKKPYESAKDKGNRILAEQIYGAVKNDQSIIDIN